MNCKNCGGKISGNPTFCPYCGSQINNTNVNNNMSGFGNINNPNPNVNMNPYPMNQNVGGFNNLNNNMNSPKKNPTTIVLIMEFVFGIIMIASIMFLVINAISKKNNGGAVMSGDGQILVCKKSGKALDQTLTLTYDGEELKKYQVDYKVDLTVNQDSLSESEQSDLMVAAFSQLGFANYVDEIGIEYQAKEDSKTSEASFSIDFDKASKSVADEVMAEDERLSYTQALGELRSNGYTCTNK